LKSEEAITLEEKKKQRTFGPHHASKGCARSKEKKMAIKQQSVSLLFTSENKQCSPLMMMQDVRQNIKDLLPSLIVIVVVVQYDYCMHIPRSCSDFSLSSLLANS
jgi:hypothetical protein